LDDSEGASPRILVAGIGNRLIADDGFGPRVVDLLSERELPDAVEVRDFGTAGITIATDLADYDAVIFVDSVDHEGEPGSLYRSKVVVEEGVEEMAELARLTLHEAGLEGLLRFSKSIGTLPQDVYLVGCKPKTLEPSLDLSAEVEATLERALAIVEEILEKIMGKK
jgi:hydrogenase maturation protease